MDKTGLLEKLHTLEKEVHSLKAQLEPPEGAARRLNALGRGYKIVISNWVLVSFLTALATATYVKFAFDVDYFEPYRNVSTTKKLAEFHRRFGDEMMLSAEYEAAAEGYKSALELRSNDVDAALSLVKAEVFLPPKNMKFLPTEVVDNKLRHLLSLFPNDEQLLVMKGIREWEKGNEAKAVELTRKAIVLKPNFVGAHLQLGYYEQWMLNTEAAIAHFETALKLVPDNVLALNNLGFCRKITLDFDEAIRLLEASNNSSPSLLTSLNLGDAYRFKGNVGSALAVHEWARERLEGGKETLEELEEKRFLSYSWVMNYMALRKDDRETIKTAVRVWTLDNVKSFLYYSLSFDHAAAQDFKKADDEFSRARSLDPNGGYNDYFLNQIQVMENHLPASGKTRDWFNQKKLLLGGNN